MKKRYKLLLLLFIVFTAGAVFLVKMLFFSNGNKFNINDVDIDLIKMADIKKTVSATGTINPSDIVQVGSQISGKIAKVFVDYNSLVKTNQQLAIIDTTILKRELQQAEASLRQERSKLKTVQLNYNKIKELYKNNYVARTEMDEAENSLLIAKENHNIAKSKYNNAKTELNYAYIVSPIDGVVISKEVEEGQTVAASFSAPTLFKIARDLKKMNIETSISESDISYIKEGKEVEFTVDAYRDKKFTGVIKQIRYNPSVEQNVVIYNVIIEIDNSELLLLPGMTAYVTITIASADNVLTIPNTTLRFKPTKEIQKALGLEEYFKNNFDSIKTQLKDRNKTLIYTVKNNKVEPIIIEKGIADTSNTEIISNNVEVNTQVISGYLGKVKTK